MKLSPKYLLAVPALALLLSATVACSDDSDDTQQRHARHVGARWRGDDRRRRFQLGRSSHHGRELILGRRLASPAMDPSDIDLISTAAFAHGHPWEQYAWLREHAPVFRHPTPTARTSGRSPSTTTSRR